MIYLHLFTFFHLNIPAPLIFCCIWSSPQPKSTATSSVVMVPVTEVFILPKNRFTSLMNWTQPHKSYHTVYLSFFFFFSVFAQLQWVLFASFSIYVLLCWAHHRLHFFVCGNPFLRASSTSSLPLLTAESCLFQLDFFAITQEQHPTIHLAQSLEESHERFPCTFLNLWLFILQRIITSLGELKHFGRQLWKISWQILNCMPWILYPSPYHSTSSTTALLRPLQL